MAPGSKVVQSEENLTKTRQGGLRNKNRSSLRQTRSTNGGEWDLVQLCVEWLARRPRPIRNSGSLYLEIEERAKKTTNHFTRKTVVTKLKEAGQPLHKIIQVTGHARESSLDD